MSSAVEVPDSVAPEVRPVVEICVERNYAAAKEDMRALTGALFVELVAATDMTAPMIERADEQAMPLSDPSEIAPLACLNGSSVAEAITDEVIHSNGRRLDPWTYRAPSITAERTRPRTAEEIGSSVANPDATESLHRDRGKLGTRTARATGGG